jgi:D-3-phosphoglycerate dehydrogenase
LVNTARGEVINEGELEAVAVARPDLVFCLDVLSGESQEKQLHSPLLNMDNVIVTPHIAGCTFESNKKAAQICAQLLGDYIETQT